MASKIQIRRDTTINWAVTNPVLYLGEPGFDIDIKKIKIGDGHTLWTDLPFWNDQISLGSLKVVDGTIGTKDSLDPDKWGGTPLVLSPDGTGAGYINIPTNADIDDGKDLTINYSNGTSDNSGVIINNEGMQWRFRKDGKLQVPINGDIVAADGHTSLMSHSNLLNRITNNYIVDTQVVWQSTSSRISSAKLVIQVECFESIDTSSLHTQTCEAIICARGGAALGDPSITVYGIVHTSQSSLALISVSRNSLSGLIEVTASQTASTIPGADISVISTELLTRG